MSLIYYVDIHLFFSQFNVIVTLELKCRPTYYKDGVRLGTPLTGHQILSFTDTTDTALATYTHMYIYWCRPQKLQILIT